MEIIVTNQPPESDKDVPQPLMELFQNYTLKKYGEAFPPFTHQAEVFRQIYEDREVFLVAGTAAGKTLAVAVPLFKKLQNGCIRKVLLMYPTIALMDDQRRVMDDLGEITGMEIGQIQGGMSRAKLIDALIKPVILTTPDAIYWFFRKNVKYSGLLIYSLTQVDEFVLDEAHLFNGLMLRNFEHLWRRIKTLTGGLKKSPRLHLLTATKTEALEQLNNSQPIDGRSKCDDVTVEFRSSGQFDRRDQMIVGAINEALTARQQKVLVVCNSARAAHQLFEKYKTDNVTTIAAEHRFKFGKVTLGGLIGYFEKAGVESELIDKLSGQLFHEEDIVLDDIPDGTLIDLSLQKIVAAATETMERQCWRVKHALWERNQHSGESLEMFLRHSLPRQIAAVLQKRLENAEGLEEQKAEVDRWLDETLRHLAEIDLEQVTCRASEFTELVAVFVKAGFNKQLASSLARNLKFEITVDADQLPTRSLSHRPVYLRWLDWLFEEDESEKLRKIVKRGLETNELQVELRHIGLWKDSAVPVIVYSGSMAKHTRKGLIDVFSDLEKAVLISTSAVEVGVDFDADTLITEECERNSFLQRFGRVGRHGKNSRVVAFVGGDTLAKLSEFADKEINREEFSKKAIAVFPSRNYAPDSQLVDANHYLINEQIGRIGDRLNADTKMIEARPIAEKLRVDGVVFNFGLRSTMPQVMLRDGVTKDPFYLLRYVSNEDLRPADSPFEVTRAKKWFTQLIFQKAKFDVIIDLEETMKASQHAFISAGNAFDVWSERGVGKTYLDHMNAHFGQTSGWNRWHPGNFILLHGDVYLSRIDRETRELQRILDADQNPLFIPNQTLLVLWGWTDEHETADLLKQAKVADWEELHYDWDRLRQNWDPRAMVILEKSTGACFATYKELVKHVSR